MNCRNKINRNKKNQNKHWHSKSDNLKAKELSNHLNVADPRSFQAIKLNYSIMLHQQ